MPPNGRIPILPFYSQTRYLSITPSRVCLTGNSRFSQHLGLEPKTSLILELTGAYRLHFSLFLNTDSLFHDDSTGTTRDYATMSRGPTTRAPYSVPPCCLGVTGKPLNHAARAVEINLHKLPTIESVCLYVHGILSLLFPTCSRSLLVIWKVINMLWILVWVIRRYVRT